MTERAIKQILLIVNPTSGNHNARQIAHDFVQQCAAQTQIETTKAAGHAWEIAEGSGRDFDCVIAVGGDGTANEVANGLLCSGSSAVFGVLPGGTGNDFANATGMQSVEHVVECVDSKCTRLIDLLKIAVQSRSRYALLYALAGVPAQAAHLSEGAVKRVFGPTLCYPVGVLLSILRFNLLRARVESDNLSIDDRLALVWAGNFEGMCSGTMRLSPNADPSDGVMEVGIVRTVSRLRFLASFLKVPGGRHVQDSICDYSDSSAMRMEADEEFDVLLDGEIEVTRTATFNLSASALQVLWRPLEAQTP